MSTYLPVLMLLAYLVCFVYIRFIFGRNRPNRPGASSSLRLARDKEEERIERARRKREANFLIQVSKRNNNDSIQLLLQSFLICGFLEVQNLAFDFTPLLFSSLSGQGSFFVTFAENWVSFSHPNYKEDKNYKILNATPFRSPSF
jgi:hypothetical protein